MRPLVGRRSRSASPRDQLVELFTVAVAPVHRSVITFPEVVPELPLVPSDDDVVFLIDQKMAARALALADLGLLQLSNVGAEALRRARTAYAGATLRADASWRAAQAVLVDLPFDAVVVKGPAIAASYSEPRLRPYTDLDLLVPAEGFAAALARFRATGWTTDDASVAHPYFWRYCREGVNLVSARGDRVDLHHHVPPWRWGARLTHAELASRATWGKVAGVPALLASPVDNLLIAALHLVSDRSAPGRSLMVWRDVVELSRRADAGQLKQTMAAAGLTEWLAAVIEGLPRELDLSPADPGDGSSCLPAPHRLSLLLNADVLARRPSLEWVARLPALNALALLAGQAAPSRDFRRSQAGVDDSLRSYWRRRVLGDQKRPSSADLSWPDAP